MRSYIAVAVPQRDGGWRIHFPDLPGYQAEGSSLDHPMGRSRQAVHLHLAKLVRNWEIPRPRSLDAIVADAAWASVHTIDWAEAIISLISLPTLRE